VSDVVPGTPGAIDDVIWRGMAKEPAKRFLSAGDLGRAAVAAAEDKVISEPERSVARGEAAPVPAAAAADAGSSADAVAAAGPTGGGSSVSAAAASQTGAAPTRPRNLKPWAIGAAAIVIAGIAAALVTGGGGGGSSDSSDQLPPGGQATVVNNAPPPKKGDKVLAAGETNVHGVHYRVVASIAKSDAGKKARTQLYFSEYMNKKFLIRWPVPDAKFYGDSVIASFKVEANPDPNPEKTAGIALSWFHHLGDQTDETQYYGVTSHGPVVY
jgi:hypothetical protein